MGSYLRASRVLVQQVKEILPDTMTLFINLVQKAGESDDLSLIQGMLFDFDIVFN